MATLSEAASRRIVSEAGVPVSAYATARDPAAAVTAVAAMRFPVVAKLCADSLAHKTERGLVRLGLTDASGVETAATTLLDAARPDDGDVEVLISEMVAGNRELIAGLVDDPAFGPTVMLGVGGIFAEALGDVVFRLAPLEVVDAHEMIDDLATQELLGPLRGEPAVDRQALAELLVALGNLATDRDDIASVDLNPLIVADGRPVAVDALVELRERSR